MNPNSKHSRLEQVAWSILLFAAVLSHFSALGERVLSYDEAVHGLIALRFAETGSYFHSPVTHGPLLFYLNGIVFLLLPASDFTARLAPALVGSALVGVPLLFKRWIGSGAAFAAGLLLASSPLILYFGRYLRNDIYILFLISIWIFAVLRYLEAPGLSQVFTLTIAMALSFACKEVSFISAALITSFLVLVAGLRWRIDPLPALQLCLQHITLVLPLSIPLVLRLVGLDEARLWLESHPRWAFASTAVGILASVPIAYLATTRYSMMRGILTFRTWLKSAVLFWLILGLYFTTFLKNPPGLYTGLFQSLNYWLDQHPVGRGNQPFYYYLIILGLYEFVVLLLAICALGAFTMRVRRRGWSLWMTDLSENSGELFSAFCAWWGLGGLLVYSTAGERMPWLAIHVLLPFVFLSCGLAADWAGRSFRNPAATRRIGVLAGLVLAGLLAFLGLRTSYRLNFVTGGLPVEPAAYAQGGSSVPNWARRIRALADPGKRVAVANPVAWPLSWYLRGLGDEVEVGDHGEDSPADFDVLVADAEFDSSRWRRVTSFTVLWWPIQDYRRLYTPRTDDRPARDRVATLWEVFYNRHFQGLEINSWPYHRDAWIYERTNTGRRGDDTGDRPPFTDPGGSR